MTGASRGIGKGICLELGAAGYRVHCLSRSSRKSDDGLRDLGLYRRLPEEEELTVEKTAEQVSQEGGWGIAHILDVSNDADVSTTISEIATSEGRLDVLVCSAYTVPTQKLRGNFWEQGIEMWDDVNGVGLRSCYMCCVAAAKPMIETAKKNEEFAPLIALVSSFGGQSYTFNVPYGVGKAAIDRLAKDMSFQLSEHNVATTSIYPGLVKTECNQEMVKMGTWAEASGGLSLEDGETAR